MTWYHPDADGRRTHREPGDTRQERQRGPHGEPSPDPEHAGRRQPVGHQGRAQQDDREDQPADQALLEAARGHCTQSGHERGAGRPGVQRSHQKQPRDRHQRRSQHLALRRPRGQRRVGEQRHGHHGRQPRHAARRQSGGQEMHGDHQHRGQHQRQQSGPQVAEEGVAPAVRRDQDRRAVHPVVAVEAVGLGRPRPGHQQEAGLVRAPGGQQSGQPQGRRDEHRHDEEAVQPDGPPTRQGPGLGPQCGDRRHGCTVADLAKQVGTRKWVLPESLRR